MNSSDTIALCACLISILALLFTFLTYKRERNKTNQDLIFQEKIIAYKELISKANETYELFYEIVEEVQEHDGTKIDWEKKFEKLCSEFYAQTFEFQKLLFTYIPILPGDIYIEMNKFCTKATGFVTSSFHCDSKITIDSYDRLEKKLHKIISLIRTDLNVEQLNIVLAKRLR